MVACFFSPPSQGLLIAASGGVGSRGASGVVVARRLTLSSGLLSLGRGSLALSRGAGAGAGGGVMCTDSFTFLSCRSVAVSSILTSSHSISWPACEVCSATADLSKAVSLQAALYSFILVVRHLPVSPSMYKNHHRCT